MHLIDGIGMKAFPPRPPEQPSFYPVTTENYAVKIARDWNVQASGGGFVTRFEVRRGYLDGFAVQNAGGSAHQDCWIPAKDTDAFNAAIVGTIEAMREFHGTTVREWLAAVDTKARDASGSSLFLVTYRASPISPMCSRKSPKRK